MALRALARVNLAAIERNVIALRGRLDDGAELCAVVKADASGHGAVPVARAALAGGATMLAVATAGEAAELRAAGLSAPLLVLGAVSDEELPVVLAASAEVVAWDEPFIEALAAAAGGRGRAPARSTSTSSSTAAWAGWARATPRRRSPSPPPSMTGRPGSASPGS